MEKKEQIHQQLKSYSPSGVDLLFFDSLLSLIIIYHVQLAIDNF